MPFKNESDRKKYAKMYRAKYHTAGYYSKQDKLQEARADKLAAKVKTFAEIVRDGTEEATLDGGGR